MRFLRQSVIESAAKQSSRRRGPVFLDRHGATRLAMTGVLALVLSGCVKIGGGGDTPDRYDLAPVPAGDTVAMPAGWSLLIETPETRDMLKTDHIAWREANGRISYFEKSRFADRLPRLMTAHLEDVLKRTGGIVSGPANLDVPSRFRLRTDIRNFEAVDAGGAITVHVRLDYSLVRAVPISVVGQKSIDVSAPAASDRAADVMRAFDAALAKADAELLAWLPEAAKAKP